MIKKLAYTDKHGNKIRRYSRRMLAKNGGYLLYSQHKLCMNGHNTRITETGKCYECYREEKDTLGTQIEAEYQERLEINRNRQK